MEKIVNLLKKLQFRADTTKFLFDKPSFDYQPIPWANIDSAGIRGEATVKRWEEISKNIIKKDKSMKDIGCCVGYFCVSAAIKFQLSTIGVDANEKFLRIARNTLPDNLVGKCNYLNLLVDNENVKLLPKTDISLCLSIWHHWVYHYGLERASKILNTIWESSNRIMFFESGEEEVTEEFKLPFLKNTNAADWLQKYLEQTLKNSKVVRIGRYSAGNYPHYKIKNVKRTLFMVTWKK